MMKPSDETVTERELSPYEIEPRRRTGGKPTRTLVHGAIHANLIVQMAVKYPDYFRIASEVTLDTKPDDSTPDLVLYPLGELDFKNDPSPRSDAPLLVVEIQSSSQSSKDMVSKLEPYFYFGVKSCWIVVPDFRAVLCTKIPFTTSFSMLPKRSWTVP